MSSHGGETIDVPRLEDSGVLDPTWPEVPALQRAKELADTIVSSLPIPLLVLDERLVVRRTNLAFHECYGTPADELLGQLLFESGRGEWNIPLLRALLENVVRQGSSLENVELRHTFDSIGFRLMLLDARRLSLGAGEGSLILLTLRDITERGQAEETLRQGAEQFAAIFNQSTSGIVQFDLAGRFILANDQFCRITGRAREDLLKLRLRDILHPDDQVAVLDRFLQLTAGECPQFVIEQRLQREDGSEVWARSDVSGIRDPQGQVRWVAAVVTDMSESRAREAELREGELRLRQMLETQRASEERYRSLVSILADVPWTTNAAGEFAEFQPAWAAFTGQTWEEMRGFGWLEMLHPDDRVEILRGWTRACASPANYQARCRLWHAGRGEWRRIFARGTPLFAADGTVREWVGATTDCEEEERAEEELRAAAQELALADRSKDEFLAMLAHELRNPLAPLRNAAEILRLPEVPAEDRDQAQRILRRQIENMSRMIDDLLDVSRITEGKIELRRSVVELREIVESAVGAIRPACQARKQQLSVSLPAEPVHLEADGTRLEQIFGNLLGNACKYSGEGSHIWVSASVAESLEGRLAVISVRDNGIGIAPELLPRVFELFVQATRALDRAHGGLGIGLTLVDRLVKLHGGSVEAKSEGVGQGSEFVVRLPVLASAPATEPAAPPATTARSVARRILVVDDNVDSAQGMAMLLRVRGHEARTALDGPAALALAAENAPEVVLLDIGLPGMDGFEVARRLRSAPGTANVALIAMSGYGSEEDRAKAREAGFDEYLVKPVELDRLRALLRSLPERR